MKVSIVIPIYNHFSLINDLLVSLHKYTHADEIIVVDDFSTDLKTLEGMNWWEQNYGVKVLRPVQNLGFLKASNYGMSKATGDILCLISSDVIVEDDLCKILQYTVEKEPNALIGGVVYEGSTGWNIFGQTVYPYAEGWLLACTKQAWNELGGFDERYAPHDAEDIDLSTTALSKGYKLLSLNNPKIRHIGGQSIGYTEEREELTKRNIEKFRLKWIVKE